MPGSRHAREAVYGALRDMIGSGALEPGTWLREEALSEGLGVSRTPLREALRALASDGLVESVPRRGMRVTTWTADDIDELYRLRALLEGYGAQRAARSGGPSVVEQLWQTAARYEHASEQAHGAGRFDAAVACNVEFHDAVLAAAGSPRLINLVQGIRSAMLVQRAFSHYTDDDRLRSVIQHRDIVRAIERGDDELAGHAMRSHILAARYSAIEASTDAAPGPPARAVTDGGTP